MDLRNLGIKVTTVIFGAAVVTLVLLSMGVVDQRVRNQSAPESGACRTYGAQAPFPASFAEREKNKAQAQSKEIGDAYNELSVEGRVALNSLEAACEANAIARANLGTLPLTTLLAALGVAIGVVSAIAAALGLRAGHGRAVDAQGDWPEAATPIGDLARLEIEADYARVADGRPPCWLVRNVGGGPARLVSFAQAHADRHDLPGREAFDQRVSLDVILGPGRSLDLPATSVERPGSEAWLLVGYHDGFSARRFAWARFGEGHGPQRHEKYEEGRLLMTAEHRDHFLFPFNAIGVPFASTLPVAGSMGEFAKADRAT